MKLRQYRLQNIPTDVWTMIKDIQRSTEQKLGRSVTFEHALYELIRILYSKVSTKAAKQRKKNDKDN